MTYKQEVYRKLIHLSSIWMLILMYYFNKLETVIIFGILSGAILAIDYSRKHHETSKKIFHCFFGNILREKEIHKATLGAVYFVLSAFATSLLFPKQIAIPAFCVMIISDTAAALVGRKYGKRKLYGEKTIEGSQAFFITAVVTLFCFKSMYTNVLLFYFAATIAAAIATTVELYSKRFKIDDNFSIPLSVGLILWILT